MKQKKLIIQISKVLLFVFLFGVIFDYTSYVLVNKSESKALSIITKQEDEYYDIILAGPSHMQYSIQPAQLFGEYGLVACNPSTAAQSIPTTYYVVKEMIEKHTPELVVVDLFCLFYPDVYFTPTRFHQAIDYFELSKNKIDAIEDLVDENKEEFYLNYLLYHSRWKTLTKDDYTVFSNWNETYTLLYGTTAFPNDFVPVPKEETAEIPEISLEYLKKIVDLCKKTDTELLLTVIPYRADVDNNNTSAILQQQMYNTVEQLASEWNVDYLNGLYYLDEMNFDFTTDMKEYSHVNVLGSEKVSTWYGQYFVENYDLPNRAEDKKYSDWYEDYEEYMAIFSKQETLGDN